MAITYTIERSGKGYGVFVKALSGQSLSSLAYKMPELSDMLIPFRALPVGYGVLKIMPVKWPAIQVKSGRIVRKSTIEGCKKFVTKLKALPHEQQIEKLKKQYLYPLDTKDYSIIKLQYFRFSRNYGNGFTSPYTTTNKDKALDMAGNYAGEGVPAMITPTIGRNFKIGKGNVKDFTKGAEVKTVYPKGLSGMTKDIKDQGPETLNRISQRRKKTTTNEFYQRYR